MNPGCHIGYPKFVGKTCENSEAWQSKGYKGDENGIALCRLQLGHICIYTYTCKQIQK